MAFDYKPGAWHSTVSPDTVGRELDKIYQARGVLHAEEVVDAARPKAAPLHPAFEWDDQLAAEQHRNWQARTLIKSVRVLSPNAEPKPAYINVRMIEPDRSGYHPLEIVVRQPQMLEFAMRDLRRKLDGLAGALDSLMEASKDHPSAQAANIARVVKAVNRARAQAEALEAM